MAFVGCGPCQFFLLRQRHLAGGIAGLGQRRPLVDARKIDRRITALERLPDFDEMRRSPKLPRGLTFVAQLAMHVGYPQNPT
jgi:hypothetical protein